jgi:hypothetical protein
VRLCGRRRRLAILHARRVGVPLRDRAGARIAIGLGTRPAPASIGDLGEPQVGVEGGLSSLGAHSAQPRFFQLGSELFAAGSPVPHLFELLALEQAEALLRSHALGALDLELGGESVALGAQSLDFQLQFG